MKGGFILDEEIFLSSLSGLEGIKIGLFLSDDKFIEGTLLSVQEDHLTVKVDGKTFYFPINQIKAVSKSAKDNQAVIDSQENVPLDGELLEIKLNKMHLQWVTINGFDNQNFTGVLHRISSDYVVLVNGDMQYFIRKEHITNIYQGFIKLKDEYQDDNMNNSSDNTQSNEEQNGNPTANSENPQNNETNTILTTNSPSKANNKMDRRKHQDVIQFKEVKFNSPMQECTWNTRKNPDSNDDQGNSIRNQKYVKNMKNEQKVELPKSERKKTPLQENKEEVNVKDTKKKEEPVMTMEDNRVLMERQYYALMKFAERMYDLEKQYETLMKHAEKMYWQLRKRRKV